MALISIIIGFLDHEFIVKLERCEKGGTEVHWICSMVDAGTRGTFRLSDIYIYICYDSRTAVMLLRYIVYGSTGYLLLPRRFISWSGV